ncbi:MAG TPA: sigma-54 dependent transcriptional regulator [Myxococcaceae bacterium]|nr:sigma-54 dependent transcriptional regulator [Myxococcaceae bacterium]
MKPVGQPLRVLIVDDEKNIRTTLAMCLEGLGCVPQEVSTAKAALEQAEGGHFDLAFVDLRLGTESGLDLIPELLLRRPAMDIVVVTAFATIDTAVEAIRRGARDYLPKPFTPAQIRYLVERVRERHRLAQQVFNLRARLTETAPEVDLETHSARMKEALDLVSRAAVADAPVLFRGESGTGKGVLARALHGMSPRKDGPFVTVNCPTLSEDLLASELFGHARGSFTGAVRDQAGRVEMADGGTLFLDEIAELSPALQAKLLRFLQDKQFERLGENLTRRSDVRVLAATNRDLDADVAEGRFRKDLLYRLNVVVVHLPPLRERREDILPLAREFLAFFARASKRAVPQLSPEAERLLAAYDWPGNVRELRNALERALIVSPGIVLAAGAFALAKSPEKGAAELGGDVTLDALEREHIERVLARAPSEKDAARILGIDASTLYRKRKRYQSDG